MAKRRNGAKPEKPTVQLTREQYRELKKLDHNQMQERISRMCNAAALKSYTQGYSDGYDHAARVCDKALRENTEKAVLKAAENTRGIGPVLIGRITEQLQKEMVDIQTEVEAQKTKVGVKDPEKNLEI